MNHFLFGVLAFWTLLLPIRAVAAEGGSGGATVTGIVTLNGRVTSDVVVAVSGPGGETLGGQPGQGKPKLVTVDQRGKKFIPHVSAVMVGTLVNFPNNDKSWHNVYSASETTTFDLGLYPTGESRGVKVLCNVHPNMEAFIVVKKHAYFAVANDRGRYRIPGLPPGEYHLEVWYLELGTKVESFRIGRLGEARTVDVDLKKLR